MTGGEVGDIEGHALLGGGGSGGCGGGGESCPSSSEELSSVKSITSTFLPLLPSLPPWLDDEELRWSEPADVRHEPGEHVKDFMRPWIRNKALFNIAHMLKYTHTHIYLCSNVRHTVCYYGDGQFTQCHSDWWLTKLKLTMHKQRGEGVYVLSLLTMSL